MTTTQLKIVLLTAEHGSISAASRELRIPQPNASSGIKALEKEMGFTLFQRSKRGIVLTEKGQLFLEHARRIVAESEQLAKLSEIDHVFRFRVGCMNYYRGREGFVKLCREHHYDELAALQFHNVSLEEGLDLLHGYKLDLVIGLTIDSLLPTISEMAHDKNLTVRDLGDTYPMITLRRGHPLITEGIFTDEHVDISVLKNYPLAAYHDMNRDFNTPYYKAVFKIPCKFTIDVDERETRFSVVSATDAFNLGGIQSQATLEQYGLVQFPYPGYTLKMICAYRKSEEENEDIRHFIELAMSEE